MRGCEAPSRLSSGPGLPSLSSDHEGCKRLADASVLPQRQLQSVSAVTAEADMERAMMPPPPRRKRD